MISPYRSYSKSGTVYSHVVEILQRYNQPEQVIVEIGCGGNQYVKLLQGFHIGTDLRPLPFYDGRGPDTCCNSQSLPFRNNSVDLIYMVAVLYLVSNADAALAECNRVLKKEGKLIVFDYNLATTRRLKKIQPDNHYNTWSPWDLNARMRSAGFKSQVIWDYTSESAVAWKRFLLKFKLVRYLKFLIPELRGLEDWNIVLGKKNK